MRNKKDYPENWSDTIRPAILKRDKYRCTTCGAKNRQWLARPGISAAWERIHQYEIDEYILNGWIVKQVFLQVCHIDNNKKNCDYSNLITKCPTCHAIMDKAWRTVMRIGRLLNPFSL